MIGFGLMHLAVCSKVFSSALIAPIDKKQTVRVEYHGMLASQILAGIEADEEHTYSQASTSSENQTSGPAWIALVSAEGMPLLCNSASRARLTSGNALCGSTGHRIILPRSAAVGSKTIQSLLCMYGKTGCQGC